MNKRIAATKKTLARKRNHFTKTENPCQKMHPVISPTKKMLSPIIYTSISALIYMIKCDGGSIWCLGARETLDLSVVFLFIRVF